uniref:Putative transcription factor IBH1 n=1 Tax=Davidia involucrata TaxID=16924 RepID=A0A5B7C2J4_DAVIN
MTCSKTRFARIFVRSLLRIRKQRPAVSSQKIKIAAYSSMARAVGTRRAWSRALLFKLRSQESRRLQRSYHVVKKKKKRSIAEKASAGDQLKQAEKLRGLVPGGETMEFCELLQETAHFIKCLATQVKVMQSIADHLHAS